MARSFENIEVWQLARVLVKNVFAITTAEKLRRNFCLVNQIQRAALSVMNNVSEGFERQSNKEFIYFLKIAKGSSGEVRSMLYALLDLKLMDENQFQDLYTQTLSISKSLSGFITYLKNNTLAK
jgi:four helix bundle protein